VPAALLAANSLDIQVEVIGSLNSRLDPPAARLSERQREAVAVAHELGYYDRPRGATHEDVADALGVAPPTASEHLQKAESKVVDSVLAEFGPGV